MDTDQRLDWIVSDLEETRLKSGDKEICRGEIWMNVLKEAQSMRIHNSSEYIMSHCKEPHNNHMGKLNILWVSNSLATPVLFKMLMTCKNWEPNTAELFQETNHSETFDHFHHEKDSNLFSQK